MAFSDKHFFGGNGIVPTGYFFWVGLGKTPPALLEIQDLMIQDRKMKMKGLDLDLDLMVERTDRLFKSSD